jgi:mitochondrial import receptor subunit TOM20
LLNPTAAEPFEAALQFYKAMKVYPTPADLLSIYDSTVKKEVLDILAEMIAADKTLNLTAPPSAEGLQGIPNVGLD